MPVVVPVFIKLLKNHIVASLLAYENAVALLQVKVEKSAPPTTIIKKVCVVKHICHHRPRDDLCDVMSNHFI